MNAIFYPDLAIRSRVADSGSANNPDVAATLDREAGIRCVQRKLQSIDGKVKAVVIEKGESVVGRENDGGKDSGKNK